MNSLNSLLSGNDFLSGGIVLILVGGFLASLRNLPGRLFSWAREKVIFTLRIESNDPVYPWVRAWLGDISKCGYLTGGILPPMGAGGRANHYADEKEGPPKFFLAPRGMFTFRFKGKRVWGWVNEKDLASAVQENIYLQWLGRDRDVANAMLETAYRHIKERDGELVEVWITDCANWMIADRKAPRAMDTLYVTPEIIRDVFDDVKEFGDRRDWYAERGVPYRRGYLFKGAPGNGKSSAVHAMASALRTNINLANLGAYENDSALANGLARVPRGHLLVIEDVDAYFDGRKARSGVKITFSGLLNAIDGVIAQEGRILIMTTNHRDKLDEALVRAGRVDVEVEFGNATAGQASAMHARFYAGADPILSERFGLACAGWSMARVQQHLMEHRDAPKSAASAAEAANERAAAAPTSAIAA